MIFRDFPMISQDFLKALIQFLANKMQDFWNFVHITAFSFLTLNKFFKDSSHQCQE